MIKGKKVLLICFLVLKSLFSGKILKEFLKGFFINLKLLNLLKSDMKFLVDCLESEVKKWIVYF